LLQRVEAALSAGVPLSRIAFLSFSTRAVAEACARLGVTREQAPYFRTIHALGYALCALNPTQVFRPSHLWAFGQHVGEVFSTARPPDVVSESGVPEPPPPVDEHQASRGDYVLHWYQRARALGVTLAEYQQTVFPTGAVPPGATLAYAEWLAGQYEAYKTRHELVDFTDMIERAPAGGLPVDLVFIDEGQDTTTAQWALLRRTVPDSVPVVIGADDDQSIYGWAGADVHFLQRLDARIHVLPKSHRLPRHVHALAHRVVSRISRRYPKVFQPRDADGSVRTVSDAHQVDLREGEWLLLARTRRQLQRWEAWCRVNGVVYAHMASHRDSTSGDGYVWSWDTPTIRAATTYHQLQAGRTAPRSAVRALLPYLQPMLQPAVKRLAVRGADVAWAEVWPDVLDRPDWMQALPLLPSEDVEYVRALRQRGESTRAPGRVRISTIHHAKGAEADHVGLFTAVSGRVQRAALRAPDEELRVQYVGITRARESLTLVRTGGAHHYRF
jgi:superfamily I DNA/RNA helicase